jgi:SNF2 family DNA or RNA helicase
MSDIVSTQFIVTCRKTPKKRDKYDITFPFNMEVIACIRKLPKEEKSWNGSTKIWTLSTRGLYGLIKLFTGSDKIHFDLGDDGEREIFLKKIKKIDIEDNERQIESEKLQANKKLWVKLKDDYERDYKKYWDSIHKNLKKGSKLFPYQVVSALFLNQTKSALLALDMGLGKTLCSITHVEMNELEKVLVITPNSLKFNFHNEVLKFTNSKAHIINWKKNEHSIEDSKYIIVNYEYFNPSNAKDMDRKFKGLNIGKIDCLICDESQRLKNNKSNTFKNFKRIFKDKIFKKKPSKIFLSGTPAPNRAHELYTVLNQISPTDFVTKKHFNEYYCGMTYDRFTFGWETDNTTQKLEELFHKIAPFTYRKKKEDVLHDLPDKIFQKAILELTPAEEKIYNEVESGIANELFEHPETNPLTIMLRLRQITSGLKMNKIDDIINGFLENDEKIFIVDMFKQPLYEIQKKYPDISVVHTGDQTVEERAEMVAQFQDPNGKVKIFLASVQTASYGLTLTAASKLLILTLPYSVGEYDQVADRLHRIGQKNTVHIYPVIFKDTIDEYVFSIIEDKRTEIMKVMDNVDYVSDVSESVISEVIKRIKEKYS